MAQEFKIMQMQLPFFPDHTKLITPTLGFRKEDDMVYYLHNGSPIFCHEEHDLRSYRYILGNLIEMGLCNSRELSKALGVPIRTVQRYAKTFREKGSDWYFQDKPRRGNNHKMREEVMDKAQQMLDESIPVTRIAKKIGVTEGAIRHHIRNGRLKKRENKQ